jgi:hypothetical protein
MRGFVVVFDSQQAATGQRNATLEERLTQWERNFRPNCLRRCDRPGCSFYLYTAITSVPAEFNQRLSVTPDETRLWVGPRVDMTDPALFAWPCPNDFDKLLYSVRDLPTALDTAVFLNYRFDAQSLSVKTDLLNSTFIYWTRFEKWLLLSNSSLTLAKLTGSGVDWVSAAEFLASGSIYGNNSLYRGIQTLKPSTLYQFGQGDSVCAHEYWRLHTLPFETLSGREACQRIVENLDKDFDVLNATGKTFILDLTGGYDSRTNVGFAIRRLKSFQTTVSGLPGDEDVVLSSAIARHFGFKHHVTRPMTSDDPHRLEYVADAALLTDLEYNVVEYAGIYHAQRQFDTLNEPSIHGSAGGDIARNIILRREFYDKTPVGNLIVEPLIDQRFRNLIPKALGRPDLPIADWVDHMRARIAEHDFTDLPAFARLDILYLRMRMQFWQGRIGSSTNRFRASLSPWTNRRVLEIMLCTRWKDRRHQMLSRLLLKALHPDLSRLAIARGEAAGPSRWSALVAFPARLRYYRSRLSIRFGSTSTLPAVKASMYDHFAPKWEEIVPNILRPEALSVMKTSGLTVHPQVLGRLVTLAHVKDNLDRL